MLLISSSKSVYLPSSALCVNCASMASANSYILYSGMCFSSFISCIGVIFFVPLLFFIVCIFVPVNSFTSAFCKFFYYIFGESVNDSFGLLSISQSNFLLELSWYVSFVNFLVSCCRVNLVCLHNLSSHFLRSLIYWISMVGSSSSTPTACAVNISICPYYCIRIVVRTQFFYCVVCLSVFCSIE